MPTNVGIAEIQTGVATKQKLVPALRENAPLLVEN
jgi:hypothetical protein